MTNPYCDALGIDVPAVEAVKDHREVNTYALLIVALIERGGPMTLAEVAQRLAAAGVAPAERALLSLKRCKPARPPVYRDGDHYSLDPHDDELGLWVFRLGLRPPRVLPLTVARPQPEPLPGPDQALTVEELEEAWKDATLSAWSAQRVVVAVIEAHGHPMRPEDVVAFVHARTQWQSFDTSSGQFGRRGSAVRVLDDGRWALEPGHSTIAGARRAVRQRLEVLRRWAGMRTDPSAVEVRRREFQRRRTAHAAELAAMKRVLVHAFPAGEPQALVLLDVGERQLTTYIGEEMAEARERLDAYQIIAAVGVRPLLRALDYDPGDRRLAELGPSQKTITINRSGRTLKITNELLIQGSCGISRPFGDPSKLRQYLQNRQHTRLRRRLESDAKSLYALYQYGRLHGCVRLQWGFLDTGVQAPWVHRDEPFLHDLKDEALELDAPLQVVAGSAPGWDDPWSRSGLCYVRKSADGWHTWLVDEYGDLIDDGDVQIARLVENR